MRKLRNCTTSSLKRWFRLPRSPQCDRAVFDVYLVPKDLDEKVSELHFPLLGAQLTVQIFWFVAVRGWSRLVFWMNWRF